MANCQSLRQCVHAEFRRKSNGPISDLNFMEELRSADFCHRRCPDIGKPAEMARGHLPEVLFVVRYRVIFINCRMRHFIALGRQDSRHFFLRTSSWHWLLCILIELISISDRQFVNNLRFKTAQVLGRVHKVEDCSPSKKPRIELSLILVFIRIPNYNED